MRGDYASPHAMEAANRAERNPVADLRRTVAGPKPKSRAALTKPDDVGKLLNAIDAYQGQPTTLAALQLAPLVFVRPGELRHAEWEEFDLDAAEWRIPAHKMKMREEHIVSLAKQAISVLRALHPLTAHSRYLFPSVRTPNRPMSHSTVNAALRALGFRQRDWRQDTAFGSHEAAISWLQRVRVVARCDRTAVSSWRTKQDSRRVQPCAVPS